MTDAPSDRQSPDSMQRPRRRAWPWICGGLALFIAAAFVALPRRRPPCGQRVHEAFLRQFKEGFGGRAEMPHGVPVVDAVSVTRPISSPTVILAFAGRTFLVPTPLERVHIGVSPIGKLWPTIRATTPGGVVSHQFGAIQESPLQEDADAAAQDEVRGVPVSLQEERWVMPKDVSRLEVLPGGGDESEWSCDVLVAWPAGMLWVDYSIPPMSHFQAALPAEAEHAKSVLDGLQACGESAEAARERMRRALDRLRQLPAEGLLDRMLSLDGDELRRKASPDDAAEYGLMVWAFSTDSAAPRHEVLRYRQAGQMVYVMRNDLSEAPDRFDYAIDAYDQAGHSAWRGRLVLKREGTPERGVPLINTILGPSDRSTSPVTE